MNWNVFFSANDMITSSLISRAPLILKFLDIISKLLDSILKFLDGSPQNFSFSYLSMNAIPDYIEKSCIFNKVVRSDKVMITCKFQRMKENSVHLFCARKTYSANNNIYLITKCGT